MQQKDPGKDPLAEKLLESGIAYKGSFLQLHRDTVKTPDGVVTTREYLHHPGASMIIPYWKTDLSSLNVSIDILYAGTFLSFLQGS